MPKQSEGQMNRIEEVKKICPRCKGTGKIIWHDRQSGAEFKGADIESPCPDCQLFPQPLDDEELREKIVDILNCEADQCSDYCSGSDGCIGCQADQILALLQLKIRQERERILGKDRPKIICLCGSTRFVDTFNEWRKKLTLKGCIVVSIELVIPQSEGEDPQHSNYKVKQMLDELHLRKIDLADEVLILNVGGYIGNSTRAEIEYAESKGKSIKYLEALSGKGAGK